MNSIERDIWLCPHACTSLRTCEPCGRRVTHLTWERITPKRVLIGDRLVHVVPGQIIEIPAGVEVRSDG